MKVLHLDRQFWMKRHRRVKCFILFTHTASVFNIILNNSCLINKTQSIDNNNHQVDCHRSVRPTHAGFTSERIKEETAETWDDWAHQRERVRHDARATAIITTTTIIITVTIIILISVFYKQNQEYDPQKYVSIFSLHPKMYKTTKAETQRGQKHLSHDSRAVTEERARLHLQLHLHLHSDIVFKRKQQRTRSSLNQAPGEVLVLTGKMSVVRACLRTETSRKSNQVMNEQSPRTWL